MSKLLPILITSTFMISGCSTMYAHLTYDFNQLEKNGHVYYESGARESAEHVKNILTQRFKQVVDKEYIGFNHLEEINIYVFSSKERYSIYSNASIESRGSAYSNDIYLSPKIGEDKNSLDRVLLHELSHLHMSQYVGVWGSITNIPTWFDEGLAVVTSMGGGAEKVTEAEAIEKFNSGKHFIPIVKTGFFSRKSAHDYELTPHMFYRQSGMFVAYLKKGNC